MGLGWKWWKWLLTAGSSAAGALLIAATQVSATQATSNLSSWAKLLGLIDLASSLGGPAIDRWGLFLGVGVFLTGSGVLAWHLWRRNPNSSVAALSGTVRMPLLELCKVAANQLGVDITGVRNDAYYFSVALRQAACDGIVPFWGRELKARQDFVHGARTSLLVPVPPDHFREHWIDILPIIRSSDNTLLRTYLPAQTAAVFYADLHVSRDPALTWLKTDAQAMMDAARPPIRWVKLADAIDEFCNPEFVSISIRYSNTFQQSLGRYREIEAEMQKVSDGGWTDRPEALEKYNELRNQYDRLGGVLSASQQGWRDIWSVLRDELTQKLIAGELVARGFVEPHSAGAVETSIKPAEWRILEPDLKQNAATKRGDSTVVIYSSLEIARSGGSVTTSTGLAEASPLEIIFDPENSHGRFWSLEQMRDETGNPVPGHLWWEYRVMIRNKSGKTVRNVKATVEAIGPMPSRPEPSQFDINKKSQMDLNPHMEELVLLRRWYNPPIMAGMVMGGAYGPIKLKVSADDVLPATKFFHFEPEKTPMISEILW